MHPSNHLHRRLSALGFVLTLVVYAPAVLQVQMISDIPAASETVEDAPLSADERYRLTGLYTVPAPNSESPPMSLRVFKQEGVLMATVDGNKTTRLLHQGNDVFRPEAATDFVLTFLVEDGRAVRVSIASPDGRRDGVRVEKEGAGHSPGASAGSPASGALYDELARLDSLLFDAAFVSCDTESRNASFTDDIEFYHDIVGFQSSEEVRAPIETCPGDGGLARHLVAGTLEVYPLEGYGAVQMGVHRFAEDGVPTVTVAKFVHVWKKTAGGWKISRVLSFDHRADDTPSSTSVE